MEIIISNISFIYGKQREVAIQGTLYITSSDILLTHDFNLFIISSLILQTSCLQNIMVLGDLNACVGD